MPMRKPANDLRPWPISQFCRDQSARLGFDPDHPEQMIATPNREAAQLFAPKSANPTGRRSPARFVAGLAVGGIANLCPDRAFAADTWALDQPTPPMDLVEPFPSPPDDSSELFPAPTLQAAPEITFEPVLTPHVLPALPELDTPPLINPIPAILPPERGSDLIPASPPPADMSWADTALETLLSPDMIWAAAPELLSAGAAWLIWRELRRWRAAMSPPSNAQPELDTDEHEENPMGQDETCIEDSNEERCPWMISVGGASHTGQVRTENQDACAVRDIAPGVALAITCDGVGGHPGGRAAARYASRKLKSRIDMALIIGLSPEEAILDALNTCAKQMAEDGIEGLTTALVALVEGDRLTWAGLGDGRICIIHPDGMSQDLLAPHHALNAPSNVITAHLGAGKAFTPRLGSLRIEPKSLVFTMSDGAGDMFNLAGIAAKRKIYLKALKNCGPDLFASNILDRLEALMHPNTKVPLHTDNLTMTVCFNQLVEADQ